MIALEKRFIPAPAGNTLSPSQPTVYPPVHPRASGEHRIPCLRPVRSVGSSPRQRGTLPANNRSARDTRFIPAPAGNTAERAVPSANLAVHPRASGEHIRQRWGFSSTGGSSRASGEHGRCSRSNSWSDGSSPRQRGTRQPAKCATRSIRFIPAPAGNTLYLAAQCCPLSVHPRASGGTPRSAWSSSAGTRFIPAPAGNTRQMHQNPQGIVVHPRASGEHLRAVADPRLMIGSSPRQRGTLGGVSLDLLQRRFIPAPSGNTSTHAPEIALSPVHPRASGEHRYLTPQSML